MANKPFELHTDLSDGEFFTLLQASGKYKERSNQTHDTVHAPLLLQRPGELIECLLLGDSMLERLKTTGAHTEIAQCSFPQIFNAGVGGDRVQNVLYRLGTKGLYHALHVRDVKHAIIQMGTNDLRPKQGMTPDALWHYALVLEAVYRAAPGVKILVTGLLPRRGEGQVLIDQSNANLEQLVRDFNQVTRETSVSPIRYMPPHPEINTSHLLDHVHLNEAGYTLFAGQMWDELKEIDAQTDGPTLAAKGHFI